MKYQNNNKIYLVWNNTINGKRYIIGRLSYESHYVFQYTNDIKKAIQDGFKPLVSFPNTDNIYENRRLFPVFSARLPDRKRADIKSILKKYNLNTYDDFELLKASGAKLPIDNLEFIEIDSVYLHQEV